MKKLLLIQLAAISVLLTSSLDAHYPAEQSYKATPSKYCVNILKIEFYNATDEVWEEYAYLTESIVLDIASALAGEAVGGVAPTADLSLGKEITKMRFLIHPGMECTAWVYDTDNDNTVSLPSENANVFSLNNDDFEGGNPMAMYLAQKVSGRNPPTADELNSLVVYMPSEDGAVGMTGELIDGVTWFWGEMDFSDISFTLTSMDNFPEFSISFDVTHAVEFVWDAANTRYGYLLMGPSVKIGVGDQEIDARGEDQRGE